MKHYFTIIILSLLILTTYSCKKEEGCTDPAAINFNPEAEKNDGSCLYNTTPAETGTFKLSFEAQTSNGQNLVFNQPYVDSLGYTIQIEGFKFYISNLTLVKTNNQEIKIKDVDLINFKVAGENYTDAKILIGDYKAIKFGIGVDSVLNHIDPSQYPNNHPLSLYQNTYWNWSTQYRFLMLEGRADTVIGSSSNINQLLIYHTGLDNLYREYQKNVTFSIGLNAIYEEKLIIDINQIFYGTFGNIDLKTESFTHATTNYNVALKATENLKTAIK